MNREYEAMQALNKRYKEAWAEYGRVRDYNNFRIESLRHEADAEHHETQRCFEQAKNEYEYGDKSMAPVYSQAGYEHRERRDRLNAEVSALCREVKEAKRNAELTAPRTDSSAFKSAKTKFEKAKALHSSAETEFKRLKSERTRLRAEFDSAHAEHGRLKEAFQNRLAEIKGQTRSEREKILEEAGIRLTDRGDAKIVKKADGTTQIYSGGLGRGDGLGHGHVVLDSSGRKTYARDAFAAHGSQNYTGGGLGNWSHREWGIIGDDHEVTFSIGSGDKSGQILIADGFRSKKDFHSHHDHYGPDVEHSDGSERIEDKGGHRGYYTGPGK